ncbi:MAG: hypothetical protein KF841_03360 [Phycisphaerae bacterium]|nr:hypothetical protein [Phycisphaerae bacterium]
MKLRMNMSRVLVGGLAIILGAPLGLSAQDLNSPSNAAASGATSTTATAPAATSSQPQPGEESLVYEVVEIAGKPLVGPIGTNILKDYAQWRPIQVGEALGRGQQIHAPARAKVKMVARPADPPTVILVEPGSMVAIEDLAIRNGAAVSRLGLGYGAVRAGVAEGQVRSDMEIASPQAVLSKRGTDIFRLEYVNGRFRMSLSDQGRGMLQAVQLRYSNRGDVIGMKSRLVTPGQQVTQRMAQAIDSMTFDRDININDVFGLVGNDRLFTMLNDRGFGFLLPFNGTAAEIFGGPTVTGQDGRKNLFGTNPFSLPSQGVRSIRDGDFGIGQAGLPDLFGSLRARQRMEAKKAVGDTIRTMLKQSSRDRSSWGRQRR